MKFSVRSDIKTDQNFVLWWLRSLSRADMPHIVRNKRSYSLKTKFSATGSILKGVYIGNICCFSLNKYEIWIINESWETKLFCHHSQMINIKDNETLCTVVVCSISAIFNNRNIFLKISNKISVKKYFYSMVFYNITLRS